MGTSFSLEPLVVAPKRARKVLSILTAHYVVDPHVVHYGLVADPEFMKLDIWRGKIDAPAVVLRVSE